MLRRYDKVLVPEMNLGQLALLLRGQFLVDAIGYNQVRGLPFQADELATPSRGAVRRRDRPSDLPEADRRASERRPLPAGSAASASPACVPAEPTRQADDEGLQVRPGGALVPGLR